jgi:ribonuclease III
MAEVQPYRMVDPDWAVAEIERRTGHVFHRRELALMAITHSSGANHRDCSNERLEFLGDAILGFTTCQYLFQNYPAWQEGDLTRVKSLVVSRQTCAEWANVLGLDELLMVGKGVGSPGRLPPSLLANSFESIVAAIFLDAGMAAAQAFLWPRVSAKADEAAGLDAEANFKSALQQLVQREYGRPPTYLVVSESGPDHDKTFCVQVQLGTRRFDAAWGKNKKQAEQRAAGIALRELEREMAEGIRVPDL